MSNLEQVTDLVASVIKSREASKLNVTDIFSPLGNNLEAVIAIVQLMIDQQINDLRMIHSELSKNNTPKATASNNRGSNTITKDWDCDHQNMGKGSGYIQSNFGY